MDFIVHYPENEDQRSELQRRVAAVHAEAVGSYLQNLPCPAEQKKEILKLLISTL